jgi:hypothetical protein
VFASHYFDYINQYTCIDDHPLVRRPTMSLLANFWIL